MVARSEARAEPVCMNFDGGTDREKKRRVKRKSARKDCKVVAFANVENGNQGEAVSSSPWFVLGIVTFFHIYILNMVAVDNV